MQSITHLPASRLSGPRIELGTERESLLQVLHEDANFGGQPAAGRPHGKDWHRPLKWGQKSDDGSFPEFRSEEPRWRLGDPEMLKNTHPHLFNVAGSREPCRDNMLRVRS